MPHLLNLQILHSPRVFEGVESISTFRNLIITLLNSDFASVILSDYEEKLVIKVN